MTWAPDYVTVEELAALVRVPDDVDAVLMGLAIAAASRSIDRSTRRQFGSVAAVEARTYTAFYDQVIQRWVVPIDDLMSVSGLTVAFDSAGDESYSTTITAFSRRPSNAVLKGWPWTALAVLPDSAQPNDTENGVKVTALWGWTEVPDAVKQACLLQASRLLARRDSPFGIAGSPQIGGDAVRLMAKIDPDVQVSLMPYMRRGHTVVFA